MKKGKLIVVSGPSGAGKGTVCGRVLGEMEKIIYSVSATTRKPREGEVDGKNYFFLDMADFEEMIGESGFLEYARVYENYYGTPKKFVLETIDAGTDVLLELDIQGAMSIKETYPEAVFIFIAPPSMPELKRRITGRGTETPQDIQKRFAEAEAEMSCMGRYDYVIVNDDIEEATEKMKAIVTAERCRVHGSAEDVAGEYIKD